MKTREHVIQVVILFLLLCVGSYAQTSALVAQQVNSTDKAAHARDKAISAGAHGSDASSTTLAWGRGQSEKLGGAAHPSSASSATLRWGLAKPEQLDGVAHPIGAPSATFGWGRAKSEIR
jgi:hypothetical protein